MAEKVSDIVTAALRLLKVNRSGEAASAAEGEDGLIALNEVIQELNLQPLMQPAKVQLTQALTAGVSEYTFGLGGNNSTRPVRISTAFVRDTSGSSVDYQVRILSNEEYSLISFKSITSTYPYNLYYRESYPLGVVTLYPVPSSNFTLFLEVQAALSTYSDVSDVIDVPPGYIKLYKHLLAIQISPEYKEPSPGVYKGAQDATSWIKRMNNDDKPIMINTARNGGSGSYDSFRSLFG